MLHYHNPQLNYKGLQPSYRDNGDGAISDLNTGLMWQKSPDSSQRMNWEEAISYAKDFVLAGHDDWRLPTIKELYSITDFSGGIRSQTPYIDTNYFDFEYPATSAGFRIIAAQFWSSAYYAGLTMPSDNATAFGFNFADGRIKGYPALGGPSGGHFARCVRGNSKYGVNDFVDNGDGTITDRATGLMWQKTDSVDTFDWQGALEYAEEIEFAGHSDWRLPNVKELQSIVDYSYAPDAIFPDNRAAAIDPIFDLTETESWFWTGTTHGDNTAYALYVCFGQAFGVFSDRRTGEKNLVDVHGAGAQRSDPKKGNPNSRKWVDGHGPQNDQIRIYNYARCVRDVNVRDGM